MLHPKKRYPVVTALIETFGFSPALATVVAVFLAGITLLAVVWVVRSAPPRTLVLTSGPAGSSFERWAEAYKKALAVHGVTLEVLPSAGSLDNFQRLKAPGSTVDIGFLSGGLNEGADLHGIESLGSIAYQPLWVFYRSETPITRLSELAGKRLAVGGKGSGTRALALALLAANGVTAPPATFLERDSEVAANGLLDGRLDAVFLMGDSASLQTLRALVRSTDVRLFNFVQADAYVRRFAFLNQIVLPEGSIDLGKNLPGQDITLVGPTVELVARTGLNSALTDLLLEVAQEVHGKANLLQKRGEFPAPQEHEIALSTDALRFYKSGKGFLYGAISSFWLANLLNRLLVVIVPVALVLIPAIRFFPLAYKWSVQLQIYRCYRPLLRLERDAAGPLTGERVAELMQRLDEIETTVDALKVPASFADQFYVLRGHVVFVRERLRAAGGSGRA
jgi:TRAP-type uncharacterized transport system substrate-binding protein